MLFLKQAYTLVAKCYDEEKDEQCIEGAQYMLNSYSMSLFLRMKLYALISMATDDWFDAEQYRNRAELLYATEINKLPVGTTSDTDFVNMRNELDELAQCRLENEPIEEQAEGPAEPLPQRLVMPSLEAIVGRGNTQEEYQRVQYLLEDCEDADEIYNNSELAAYADALQHILDSGGVPSLVALRLCILISSVATLQIWTETYREMAEDIWQELRSKLGSQMPPEVESFMQASRRELDLLLKDHQETAAKAEAVSPIDDTSGDAAKLTLPHHLKLRADATKFVPGASAFHNQVSIFELFASLRNTNTKVAASSGLRPGEHEVP